MLIQYNDMHPEVIKFLRDHGTLIQEISNDAPHVGTGIDEVFWWHIIIVKRASGDIFVAESKEDIPEDLKEWVLNEPCLR